MKWQASPVLGVRDVRRVAESSRDGLGFDLDPVDEILEVVVEDLGGHAGSSLRSLE